MTAPTLTTRACIAVVAALGFLVLASVNSGGYRYGVSDQAYYLPAIEHHLEPGLFPRDAAMLNAQSRLITSDELLAGATTLFDVPLPTVAIWGYVMSLLILLGAAVAFTRSLGFSWWAVAAFGILLTLRHRITRTGANSIEGYLHPRVLAFGFGVAVLACLLKNRPRLAAVCFLAAALLHPTTALFFAVVATTWVLLRFGRQRNALLVGAAVLTAAAAWVLLAGPLAGRLTVMDPAWLDVLAGKDYLFPTDWPIDAWVINLLYPVVIAATWHFRSTRGLAHPDERMLLWGAIALTLLFLVSVPLTAMQIALAVQLQITRVFWILDFVALAYVAWWITRVPRHAMVVVALLGVASAARGYYLIEVWQPERQLATIDLPDSAWTDAMRWLDQQPTEWHVLADPGHAWKYGSSVRVAARKDTVLESVKDSAIALYDRDNAMRVAERTRDLVDYERLTTTRVRALDAEYDLDAVVVESAHVLDLPVLYRNAQFVIYDIR